MSSFHTTIGRIERVLVVMACVLDVVRVLYSIKRGHQKTVGDIPTLIGICCQELVFLCNVF